LPAIPISPTREPAQSGLELMAAGQTDAAHYGQHKDIGQQPVEV